MGITQRVCKEPRLKPCRRGLLPWRLIKGKHYRTIALSHAGASPWPVPIVSVPPPTVQQHLHNASFVKGQVWRKS